MGSNYLDHRFYPGQWVIIELESGSRLHQVATTIGSSVILRGYANSICPATVRIASLEEVKAGLTKLERLIYKID